MRKLTALLIFLLSTVTIVRSADTDYIKVRCDKPHYSYITSSYWSHEYDYESLGRSRFAIYSEGLRLIQVSGKYGYADSQDNIVIEPQFGEARPFSDGLAAVQKDRYSYKWGFIDHSGNFVIEPKFYEVTPFNEGLAAVKLDKKGKWGFIDKTGNFVIQPQFYDAYTFNEGLAVVQLKKNSEYGYIDKSGNFVIQPQFYNAKPFNEGLAAARPDKNSEYGYIDKTGNFVIQPQFYNAKTFNEGFAAVNPDGKWGYINKSGSMVVSPRYDYNVSPFTNGYAIVKDDHYNWILINKYGREILSSIEDPCFLDNGIPRFNETTTNRYGNSTMYTESSYLLLKDTGFKDFLDYQLGSFETYLERHNIKRPSEATIRAIIETEISDWQQKGEFEPTQQWQQRVNEQTRAKKARKIADRIIKDYNAQIAAARKDYEKEYNDCVKQYCDRYSDDFRSKKKTLHPYDADNQTFLISVADYGDILLPVPVSAAPQFKENWDTYYLEAQFVIANDKAVLKSVIYDRYVYRYVYDSNTKADYAQTDIDYNFKPIDIANLDLNFGNISDGNNQMAILTTPEPTTTVLTPHEYTPEKNKITAGSASDVDINIPTGNRKADNTFAVVIANTNYIHASQVANAQNDGRIMAQYLSKTLGLPEKNITTCFDATYGQMAAALTHLGDIADAYGPNGFNVIFYYVGHGLPNDDSHKAYILPVDVDPRITDVCYPLDKLYSQLGQLGAKSVTVMIDACFSGANHGGGLLIPQAMGVAIKAKESQPAGNMVVMSAAQGDETAFPYASQGHSLFTYWLLKKLKETRGNVTLGALSDYVIDNVKKTSVVENHKRQTPAVATSQNVATIWRDLPLIP